MTGTILNAIGILIGGLAGLSLTRQISPAGQRAIKILLGAFTVYVGLSTTWQALRGPLLHGLGQLGIAILALMLGNLTGKLLRIQRRLNRLGQYAKQTFAKARPEDPNRLSDGFITCSILYCVGPIAMVGALQDGLAGNWRTLGIKAVMDGFATMAFVTTFGWGVMLSIVPVVAYQGTITLLARALQPWLEHPALIDAINATGGLMVFSIALVILEIKKVELADYLPSLLWAPLLAWWLG